MKDNILKIAQEAFEARIDNGTVSDHTKNSNTIAKFWMTNCFDCDPDRIETEVSVHPSLNQRIDILDTKEMTAYEFKVSGKNAVHEFYKDVVKIILWNEKKENKIKRLVFITEKDHGRKSMDSEMPRAFMEYLSRNGLEVSVEYVTHKK